MTIDDKIKEEKIQYDMSREAAKITALSSGKIDKYECVYARARACVCVCGCVCVCDMWINITVWSKANNKQAKFTESFLGKAFEKQARTTENHYEKQIKAIEEHGKQLAESNALVNKIIIV